jgi:hypothetical protein
VGFAKRLWRDSMHGGVYVHEFGHVVGPPFRLVNRPSLLAVLWGRKGLGSHP